MNDDYPIVIGLCGKAGAGKTISAQGIVPGKVVRIDEDSGVAWDHLFFALPLYRLASIRRQTDSVERQLYQTMEAYLDLYGSPIYGGPKFEELVEITYETVEMPISMNIDDKPRDFLQQVGSMCRVHNPYVFSQWMQRKFNSRFNTFKDEYRYVSIISDLRFPEEAEMITNQPNGFLIKLEASDEVRADRLYRRDQKHMTTEQLNHISEQFISEIECDASIDTDDLSVDEQALAVKTLIENTFNIRSLTNAN
jgi:hypothetical protein